MLLLCRDLFLFRSEGASYVNHPIAKEYHIFICVGVISDIDIMQMEATLTGSLHPSPMFFKEFLLYLYDCLFLLRLLIESVHHVQHGVAWHHVVPCLLYALRVHRVADVGELAQQVEAVGDEGEVALQDALR